MESLFFVVPYPHPQAEVFVVFFASSHALIGLFTVVTLRPPMFLLSIFDISFQAYNYYLQSLEGSLHNPLRTLIFTVSCSVVLSCSQQPLLPPGIIIEETPGENSLTSTLTVSSLSSSLAGQYTCAAMNSHGSDISLAYIRLEGE